MYLNDDLMTFITLIISTGDPHNRPHADTARKQDLCQQRGQEANRRRQEVIASWFHDRCGAPDTAPLQYRDPPGQQDLPLEAWPGYEVHLH